MKFFPIRNNSNAYPGTEKNCLDDFDTGLPDDRLLCDTSIHDNTNFINKKITTRIYLVPYCISICGIRYKIHSRKTDAPKNVAIQKITERSNSNTIFEDTYDKLVTQLIWIFKIIVKVLDSILPYINITHSVIFAFYENIGIDAQYITEASK